MKELQDRIKEKEIEVRKTRNKERKIIELKILQEQLHCQIKS